MHGDITIPGKEQTVSRGQKKDLYIVIHDALTLQADSADYVHCLRSVMKILQTASSGVHVRFE
jgi:hypothetical protein